MQSLRPSWIDFKGETNAACKNYYNNANRDTYFYTESIAYVLEAASKTDDMNCHGKGKHSSSYSVCH